MTSLRIPFVPDRSHELQKGANEEQAPSESNESFVDENRKSFLLLYSVLITLSIGTNLVHHGTRHSQPGLLSTISKVLLHTISTELYPFAEFGNLPVVDPQNSRPSVVGLS
jgi:hypothetical protein